jgi:hypothetical protein
MSLVVRAQKLTDDVQKALNSGGAYMIPGAVKGIIQAQNHLMEDMAKEIERLQGDLCKKN